MEGQQLIVILHQGWTFCYIKNCALARNRTGDTEHIPKRNSDESNVEGFGSLVHAPLDVAGDSAGTF